MELVQGEKHGFPFRVVPFEERATINNADGVASPGRAQSRTGHPPAMKNQPSVGVRVVLVGSAVRVAPLSSDEYLAPIV
jgi:hypothetical protein